MQTLLTLPIRTKRDLFLARQKARLVASMFHFEIHEQACIAAGSFAIATQAWHHEKSAELCIQVEDKTLHVFARRKKDGISRSLKSRISPPPENALRLVKPLPARAAEFSEEDLRWLLSQLNQQSCFNLFEELQRQNQEMLVLLHALHAAQSQLQLLTAGRQAPSAA